MAETERIVFDYKEIVTALIKAENIHEGIWMLFIEFGLAAVNAPVTQEEPKTEEDALMHLMPTAIVPVKKIGIQRASQLSGLAVDAAVVNPKPRSTTARRTPKTK